MSFPAYLSYRNSGVDWLGTMPSHWEVAPYKRLIEIQNGADYKHVEQPEGYPVIGSGGPFTFASDYLYDGESVLLGRKGTIDKPLHVKGRFWTVDTMYWSKIRSGISGRFAYYTATTIPFGYYSTNTALPSMTQSALNAHLVGLPPLSEQTAIAAFLDRETDKIDVLVEEQRRLIALLKEKRQAVISHAVTKGLDPTVPMKDSGVEWLGNVPAHWEVVPVRYLATMAGRIGFRGYTTADLVDEGEGAVSLSPSNLRGGRVGFDKCTYLSWDKYDESPEIKLERNDVILVKTGSTYGKVAILRQADFPKATINPQLLLLKNAKCNPVLLFYVLDSASIQAEISVSSTGGTIPTITQEFVGELKVPLPPLEEQEVIVEHLDALLAKLSELEREAERTVTLLCEHRAALISAAVTGKIDVRGVAMRQAEAA